MTKRTESKKADPSLLGLVYAIASGDSEYPMRPLAPVGQPIIHHECNRAAGVDVPVKAEEVATP